MAKERQAINPALTFAAARDLTMEAEPELAKGWLGTDED